MADTATNNLEEYEVNITMTCGGCTGAVDRVLKKAEGVQDVNVDLDTQLATFKADPSVVSYDAILEKIKKTGKTVNWAKVDGGDRAI